ncbi:hypothetical protein [Roseivirga pacifica]|uniref:hypothetical protein n=1 Tax=Roseivirga pacifica TaxID=1267423 RepID=UPI002095A1F7|nr:hypothetical protein [Roseivirga pacifica]MCO6359984.1 hypothetical protein [Roseivirga pacifica]MCO6367354.1 hypothetical protein [Roseivirga pacifica]MCO6370115.1 hypothetical protein [Roseivirga pacifica]MCO6375011.1 hypothetical protein [Roseivirga pacifica]MCO6380269.1 hypothetical protein [Roseivirga pacifica]
MNKKTITVIGILAIAAITAGYMYLGGLNKIDYSVENISDYNLVGEHFQGNGDDAKIEEAFIRARGYVEDGTLNGVLTLVHYNDTTLVDKEIKLFIGVALNKGTANLPDGYQRLTIPAKRAMRATIEAHNVVMPSPETIEDNLIEKAAEYGFKLQDFTIEQYISEQQLIIDMPAK